MKINNINKKDLIIVVEKEKEIIEITLVPIDDIEDEDLSLIICLGEENNPVDINFLNYTTASIIHLLSINAQKLQSIPERIVFTVPENLPIFFPQAEQYLLEETTWEDLIDKIDDDLDLIDENWFFMSVGEHTSENDVKAMVLELKNRYPKINGLIVGPKITVFYE